MTFDSSTLVLSVSCALMLSRACHNDRDLTSSWRCRSTGRGMYPTKPHAGATLQPPRGCKIEFDTQILGGTLFGVDGWQVWKWVVKASYIGPVFSL
jgi:hypothetical protein